ncbi:MAG: F0F1 ATP synthase subunit alpha, partial [Acidobacteriota bacterium]
MQIKVNEITDILRRQIEGLETSVEMAEVGTVVSVGDGIARVFGLDRVMAGEMVEFPHGVFGLALNLEEDGVGCVLMGETHSIGEGDEVRRTGKILSVPVGPALVGRVVNSLGLPIDGKGPIAATAHNPIERVAPGVVRRQPVKEPVQTGIKAIDGMIPIGRGQREL